MRRCCYNWTFGIIILFACSCCGLLPSFTQSPVDIVFGRNSVPDLPRLRPRGRVETRGRGVSRGDSGITFEATGESFQNVIDGASRWCPSDLVTPDVGGGAAIVS
ncbi:hypothetical protein QBC39DRAFT_342739 [Podospora conica]|nr:hypothetical protein QBC39DRAFT_342739 [Schizothecium conicum]